MKKSFSKNYPVFLLVLFTLVWAILAISPVDRANWFVENIPVFAFAPLFLWLHSRLKFSNFSCTMLALFLTLHAVGSHYTYSQTPFFSSFNGIKFDRDYYDKLVHFSFGLLLYLPIRELLSKVTNLRGIVLYAFSWMTIIAFAGVYEIFEWLTAILVSPKTALSFLGMQGDMFDTQKDIAMAFQGGLIALFINLMKNLKYSRA